MFYACKITNQEKTQSGCRNNVLGNYADTAHVYKFIKLRLFRTFLADRI